MKTPTLPRVGRSQRAVRGLGLLAMAVTLLGAAGLQAQTPTITATTVTTLAGGPQAYNPGSSFGYSNSISGALESQYHTPSGIAVDNGLGLLYIADRDNNAVRVIDNANPREAYTFAPYPPYIPTNLISQPVGVAVDGLDDVYVLNRGTGANGTVVEIDYFGNYLTNMTGLTNANGITLDTQGNIYVTTSNTVFRITAPGVSNVVATITNDGVNLQGIVVKRSGANAGLLAVCDAGRNGIYLINPTNGVVATNAGFNGVGDGTGINNRGITNSQAQFFQPSGLAEAGDGSLVVADFGNNRVKLVAASGYTTNLYGVSSNDWWTGTTGSGQAAYLGWSDGPVWQPDGGPSFGNVQARMPFGVAIGADGTIYTTEDYYHIIRKVTGANIAPPLPLPPPPPTSVAATAGYGQVVLTWSASSGATDYNVKRAKTSGGETTIAGTAGTSFTDTNLLDGVTYYYEVSALNTGGESQNSDESSATPLFSPTPTNLIVVTTNFNLIRLAWAPSAGATGYNLKRSQSSVGPFSTIATNVATLTFDDTSVVNGDTYYYVVTAINPGGENPTNSNLAIGRAPLPPVPDPQIGWVTFPPPLGLSVFHVGSQAGVTFNNDVPIVILGAAGSQTFYTYTNTLDVTNVPDPTSASSSAPVGYTDGLSPSAVSVLTVAQILPNVAIKAIGEQSGHPNSGIVSALFQFVVANPGIYGNNAGQFTISNITAGAQMYYTTDGSPPTPTNPAAIGPVSSGAEISLQFPANTNVLQFAIRGFKANYQASATVTNFFTAENFVANTISFGFASGEASSDFIGAAGQTFYAPVTLTTLPGTPMYSLQFNVTVNPGGTNPGPALASPPAPFDFTSMLMKLIPGSSPPLFTAIPPMMFVSGTGFTNLMFTNLSENLLGVGWVERAGATNLYDTTKQTVITYSLAHDDLFPNAAQPNGVIVGGYSFQVPLTAALGQTYQIQLGRPSATSDGIGAPGHSVFIAAPTNGSLTAGAINAVKNVTVGSRKYLVGNVYPFRWFNAGDFGDTNLQNADVEQVFEAAIYQLNSPAFQAPGSDFFDAMDSCGLFGALDTDPADPLYNVYTNAGPLTTAQKSALFDGNDTTINQVAFGDGKLDVCDVYVTYRRSLDTNSLVWFQRFWLDGVRVAVASNAPAIISAAKSSGGKSSPAFNSSQSITSVTNTPGVRFSVADFQAGAGQTIQIPVTASVFGPYPLRVASLNVSVVPLDGSPALTTPVSFTPGAALGQPLMTDSHGSGNYAAAWLNSTIPGISNNGTLGTLTVTLPANATSLSAYAVHFDEASGSPNGLASFPKQTWTGLITLSSRTNSTYNDGIPDAWRLRWFGTIYNQLSVSNACPSGDGINNWQKYIAGVDPNTPNDFPSLNPVSPASGANPSIYWPTVNGKQYVILSSASLFPGQWTTNTIVTGNGANMEFDDQSADAVKFYRVLILP